MLQQSENKVKIEGILSEIDISTRTYTNKKTGAQTDCISGVIKVHVEQVVNGKETVLEIPVHLFANKITAKGALNPAYSSIEKIMNEYVSIAASNIESADRIRITNGQIQMNEYYNQNGQLVSFPRISATFVNKIPATEMQYEATFSTTFVIGAMSYETDADGVEIPNRFKVRGIIPQYGGNVDVVDFFAVTPNTIDGVNSMWAQGDTVSAMGKLNFTSTTEERIVEVAFGDPKVEKRTISVSEFIITGGTPPKEGDFAIDNNEIQDALTARQARLANLKASAENKTRDSGTTKTQSKPANRFSAADLGF